MKDNQDKWEKIGRIISPQPDIPWMSTWAGPATAYRLPDTNSYRVLMAGRDDKNRSQIGSFDIEMEHPTRAINISHKPLLSFSEPGAFDENGVSYPWIAKNEEKSYLYFNGWMPSVLTPFQIHLGAALENPDGSFTRVSRAPILERTNDDYLSIGSVGVMTDNGLWRMWYTAFTRWGKAENDKKHYYCIKYAESDDGIHWRRNNQVCIDFADDDEFSICRPSVIKHEDRYHMWFSHRGEQYRIGYAYSQDGVNWVRDDSLAGIDVSEHGWDSKAICYSFVFEHEGTLYMLYCGNEYGREGLGIARLRLS